MSSADVFVPSQGDLITKDSISHGIGASMDTFRRVPKPSSKPPSRAHSRPGTQGTARFGALSHNSFFARHNPHPGRVRHIKGLLDVPICAVNDEVLMANPQYALNWPPSHHDDNRIKSWSRYQIPANAINVNTQLYPINTITGLQYFLGKPMNMRIYSEAIVPRRGISDAPDRWEEELRAITEAVLSAPPPPPAQTVPAKPPSRQKTQYSATTGRLIPPPSRAMSRGASRSQKRDQVMNSMAAQFLGADPQPEAKVMHLLCQILQTDDINAVKQWLVSAGDREKNMVMDMIKSAMAQSEDVQYPELEPKEIIVNGSIGDSADNADRLMLDAPDSEPQNALRDAVAAHVQSHPTKLPPLVPPPIPEECAMTTDVFKPPASARLSARRPMSVRERPASGLDRPLSPVKPQTPQKLKYTQADSWNQEQSMQL